MSQFVDECQVNVRGGDGGAGCVSYRREAYVPKGGPDGGDGGGGGHVWLVADHNVASLLAFRDHPHRRAGDGTHGSGKDRHGKAGADCIVTVPEGTVVLDRDGEVLADLRTHGDRILVARGGVGGKGNARFLSNRRRVPNFAEQGEVGEERWLRLELKLLADVAIVGFPNVGKSTFIAAVSAAKPKIADYPFTTLEPNLGVVRLDDGFEMVLADIPGLIEGASEGKGLGHRFLRHIERARVLLVLLDLALGDAAPPEHQLDVLLHELGEYQPDLLDRPRVVVGSRADIAAGDPDVLLAPVRERLLVDAPPEWERTADPGPLVMSAVTRTGTAPVVGRLAAAVRAAREDAAVDADEPFVIHRPEPVGFRIVREDDGTLVVLGRPAERAVALNDLTNIEALEYLQSRLKKLGVDKALARAGAVQGDTVRIGRFEFEYEEDE